MHCIRCDYRKPSMFETATPESVIERVFLTNADGASLIHNRALRPNETPQTINYKHRQCIFNELPSSSADTGTILVTRTALIAAPPPAPRRTHAPSRPLTA